MPNKETAKSELLATLDAADGSGARPHLSAAMDTFLHLLEPSLATPAAVPPPTTHCP